MEKSFKIDDQTEIDVRIDNENVMSISGHVFTERCRQSNFTYKFDKLYRLEFSGEKRVYVGSYGGLHFIIGFSLSRDPELFIHSTQFSDRFYDVVESVFCKTTLNTPIVWGEFESGGLINIVKEFNIFENKFNPTDFMSLNNQLFELSEKLTYLSDIKRMTAGGETYFKDIVFNVEPNDGYRILKLSYGGENVVETELVKIELKCGRFIINDLIDISMEKQSAPTSKGSYIVYVNHMNPSGITCLDEGRYMIITKENGDYIFDRLREEYDRHLLKTKTE